MAEYILRDQAIIAVTGAKLPDVSAIGLPIANGKRSVTDCVRRLKDIPAADVRPVVRGKWLNDFCGKGRFSKRIVQCSLCGNFLDLDGVNAGRGDANYCPNCGADMREPPKEESYGV